MIDTNALALLAIIVCAALASNAYVCWLALTGGRRLRRLDVAPPTSIAAGERGGWDRG